MKVILVKKTKGSPNLIQLPTMKNKKDLKSMNPKVKCCFTAIVVAIAGIEPDLEIMSLKCCHYTTSRFKVGRNDCPPWNERSALNWRCTETVRNKCCSVRLITLNIR